MLLTCAGQKEVSSEQRQAGGERTWGGSSGGSSRAKALRRLCWEKSRYGEAGVA